MQVGCVMAGVVEKLKRVGLTEYEAKAYLALLNAHLSTATQISEKSGVPRTKIYAVLESLENKGGVTILSGVPLLFKAVTPAKVFEQIKEDYMDFLNSAQTTLAQKVNTMKEKFVIKKFDVGLEGLKEEIKQLAPIATTKARIYVDYRGQEANSGSVNFASRNFSVIWVNGKILDVSAMEYSKCVKCLTETFDGSWRYAQKW